MDHTLTTSLPAQPQSPAMALERVAQCGACGGAGDALYGDVEDRLFGVPGRWNLSRCRNIACGALWLDPRPTEADIGRAYQTYYTHGEDDAASTVKRLVHRLSLERSRQLHGLPVLPASPVTGRITGRLLLLAAKLYPGLTEYLDLMTRYVPPPAHPGAGRLLDIGCGNGEALSILQAMGWQVWGLETDPAAAAAARRRGLVVHEGTLADAGYAPGSFDLVTSSHVIEHLHDPVGHMRQVRALLREQGAFVIITPNVRCKSHERHGRFWRGLEVPRHIMVHTPESLRHMVGTAGFSGAEVITTPRAVNLSEIAALQLRAGQTPALQAPSTLLKLRALLTQWRESMAHRPGTLGGNEIVVIARR